MPQELNGRFECTEGTSNKFYQIRYQRNTDTYICTYGTIGSSGVETEQEHDFVLKKHRGFASKGYHLVEGSNSVITGRQSLPSPTVSKEPVYKKSRLESIGDEEESVKPKEKKKVEKKNRLSQVD